MALAPETPRRPRRRQTAHASRTRSNKGKVLATLLAVGTTTGVGRGYLSYFRDETDNDFHVVITDKPGDFAPTKADPPNGRSMVVEFPDAGCFAGKTGLGPHTSVLGQTLAEARLAFEEQTKNLNGKSITKAVPVTVTDVGFFDFDHFQTGRAIPHARVDGQNKVFELHPVTAITFDAESEPD